MLAPFLKDASVCVAVLLSQDTALPPGTALTVGLHCQRKIKGSGRTELGFLGCSGDPRAQLRVLWPAPSARAVPVPVLGTWAVRAGVSGEPWLPAAPQSWARSSGAPLGVAGVPSWPAGRCPGPGVSPELGAHTLPVPLSLQGTCCSRWQRCTGRSRTSWRRW